MYANAGGTYSEQLRPYIGKIGVTPLVDDNQFKQLLRDAGKNDPVMHRVQDEFFDKRYFEPAMTWADSNGFTLALSALVIYDSFISIAGPFSVSSASASLKPHRQTTVMRRPGSPSTSMPVKIGWRTPITRPCTRPCTARSASSVRSSETIGTCLNYRSMRTGSMFRESDHPSDLGLRPD